MQIHLYGMWVALSLTGAAIATVVAGLALRLREREKELVQAKEAQA